MLASELNGAASPANWARKIAGPLIVFMHASPCSTLARNLGEMAWQGNAPFARGKTPDEAAGRASRRRRPRSAPRRSRSRAPGGRGRPRWSPRPRSSCAFLSRWRAWPMSMSSTGSASSASTMQPRSLTSAKPPPTKMRCVIRPPSWISITPGRSSDMNRLCWGSTPKSPSAPGATTMSTISLASRRSGATSSKATLSGSEAVATGRSLRPRRPCAWPCPPPRPCRRPCRRRPRAGGRSRRRRSP